MTGKWKRNKFWEDVEVKRQALEGGRFMGQLSRLEMQTLELKRGKRSWLKTPKWSLTSSPNMELMMLSLKEYRILF